MKKSLHKSVVIAEFLHREEILKNAEILVRRPEKMI